MYPPTLFALEMQDTSLKPQPSLFSRQKDARTCALAAQHRQVSKQFTSKAMHKKYLKRTQNEGFYFIFLGRDTYASLDMQGPALLGTSVFPFHSCLSWLSTRTRPSLDPSFGLACEFPWI
jgi:hypothetical protein